MVKAYDKGGEDFKPCPTGNHAARVCEVVFLGTVHEEYQGKAKDSPQIRIGFEIPTELREDGEPFVVSTMPMTLSVNKKANFRKLAQGIVPFTPEMEKEFEADMLMGQTCLVNIIHKASKTDANAIFANITGASPLPKGMEVAPAINKPFNFDANTSSVDDFNKLPEFIQKKVSDTPEWKARFGDGTNGLPPVN